MSLDSKILEAVRTAAEELGQSPALARRMVAWLTAVADGNEDINDVDAADRRMELIYEAVALAGQTRDAGDDAGTDKEEG